MFKRKLLDESLTEIVKGYYINEDVTPASFNKLSAKERALVGCEATLYEFLDLNIHTSKNNAVFSLGPETLGDTVKSAGALNKAYFDKIIASGGDITKTAHYDNCKVLIGYALSTNDRAAGNSPEMKFFNDKITEFKIAIKNLEDHKDVLKHALAYENVTYKNSPEQQIITQYYVNIVMSIDLGVDILYSASICADIDYTTKPAFVKSIRFECKKDFLSNHVAFIHQFNSLCMTGKLREMISKKSVDQLVLAKDKLMQENVIDVAFAILTSNKFTEALLMPLYMIRYCVYYAKYLSAAYTKIVFGFTESLAMIKKTHVSEEDFNAYKHSSDKKASAMSQASEKSALDISQQTQSRKQDFKELSSAGNNTADVLI